MMNTFVSISLCHRFVVLLLRRSIRHYRVLKQVNIRINYHNCVLLFFIFVHMLCEKHKEKREYARICTCEHFGCLIHARNTCTHAFFFLSPDKVFRPLFFPSCLSQPCDRGQKNLIFFILCFEWTHLQSLLGPLYWLTRNIYASNSSESPPFAQSKSPH